VTTFGDRMTASEIRAAETMNLKDRADTALDWLRQWATDPGSLKHQEVWAGHGHELVDQLHFYIERLEGRGGRP
jgi:hypothetical protein